MDVIETLSGYGWLLVPIGLFLGLLGYRVYRLSLFLVGVFAGLAIGSWIGSETGNNQLYLILGLVIGVVAGFVSYFLVKFSFFVLGIMGGFVLSFFVIRQIGLELEPIGEVILMLTTAFVGGVLTVLLYKSLIIVFTSIVGTALIYQATIHYFPQNSDNWSWILYIILLLVFIIVQMSGRRHHSNPVERSRRR